MSGGLKGDHIMQHQLKGDRVSPNQLKGDELGPTKLDGGLGCNAGGREGSLRLAACLLITLRQQNKKQL